MHQADEQITKEFPLHTNECAFDTGGVARDMLSAFWEQAYLNMFDGGNLFIPAVHHPVDMEKFPTLGAIISHGYLACANKNYFSSASSCFVRASYKDQRQSDC